MARLRRAHTASSLYEAEVNTARAALRMSASGQGAQYGMVIGKMIDEHNLVLAPPDGLTFKVYVTPWFVP